MKKIILLMLILKSSILLGAEKSEDKYECFVASESVYLSETGVSIKEAIKNALNICEEEAPAGETCEVLECIEL